MPSSSFVFGNFYVASSARICCRLLPRFRSFARVACDRRVLYLLRCSCVLSLSVSSPLLAFSVSYSVLVVWLFRFWSRRFSVRAFIRFVVVVGPCFQGRICISYRVVRKIKSFTCFVALRSFVLVFLCVAASSLLVRRSLFLRYRVCSCVSSFVGSSILVMFVTHFPLSFFVSSSCRYFVVVYRTDERLVHSLIVSFIVVFSFS